LHNHESAQYISEANSQGQLGASASATLSELICSQRTSGSLWSCRQVLVELELILLLSISLRLYILPYWSNPLFLIFGIRVLWHSGLSARAPECQKLNMAGLTSMAKCNSLKNWALKG